MDQNITEHVLYNKTEFLFGNYLFNINTLTKFHEPFGNCQWVPVNHFLFQFAYFFLILAYCALNNIYGILFLRIAVLIGSVCSILWSLLVICSIDTLFWSAIIVFINIVHIIVISCKVCNADLPKKYKKVYEKLFKPLKVSHKQFHEILKCKWQLKQFPKGSTYSIENTTKVDNIGLILSGKFEVSKESKIVGTAERFAFLGSPEWFVQTTFNDCFVVSITALEDSEVLIWHRDKLKLILKSNHFLSTIFKHLIAEDVVHKIFKLDHYYLQSFKQEAEESNNFTDSESCNLLQKESQSYSHNIIPLYYDSISENLDATLNGSRERLYSLQANGKDSQKINMGFETQL